MLTTTNFVGEVSASIGTNTNTFDVVATDLSGNKTTKWYQVPITANGLDTVLTYDAAGNTLSKSNAAGMMTFGWDGANRCVAITNGIYRTALSYEGASRWARITEYSNSVVIADRRFIWNGVTLAEERDANNNVVQRFYSDGFQRGGTNYFYIKDHLGSVREVYSQSGVLQARFDYDPYGNKTQTYGTLKIDFGFAGLFELPNGIKLAVWRLYDPSTARWLSKDPIREQGGLNLYAYCGGDPLVFSDVLGLWTWNNVRSIIENSIGGEEVIAQIRRYGATIYRTGPIYDESGIQWPGMTLPSKEIWLEAGLDDFAAAVFLVHELRHVKQDSVLPNMSAPCREYDAYAFQERWLIANSYPSAPVGKDYKPLRNPDNSLNMENLIFNVDKKYHFDQVENTRRTTSVQKPYTSDVLKKRVY